MLFLARSGSQRRYLPERNGNWSAVRVGAGHGEAGGGRAGRHDREPLPSMVTQR